MHVWENIEMKSGIWKYETTRDVKLCSSAPAHVDCFAHQATVIANRLAQASGNSSIPLICGGDACKSSSPVDLIKSSLSRPDAITPAYAEGPPGHKNPGCGTLSKTPKWTLGTIIFIHETGDGPSDIQTRSIQFQVTNEATCPRSRPSPLNNVPYTIEDPIPIVYGSTISSVVSPSRVLGNFELDKSTGDGMSLAAISFNLWLNTQNSLFDFPVFVYHDDVKLSDAETWYTGSFGAGQQSLAPKTCSFR
ncbi:hypothetical protein GE21DRAFT_5400 [Neurospora crassa]|uniref:Uncharacterized protein n=1 Tax=Neurospora crassa (strain ATCC 24698 / 74-OR23-1A / CBS 708.71 / DSM 1257 / FGSC 987) TaxID=367110 RepID=A7UWJ2_NEUCR|nr:hypothetical protein NCU11043 [Neurospora crassa OR74A]EDO65179.2 hypothetical protein NCU11043 [Neurospora crassa OR74A]KHE81598.1 hypothetical protein GE21DRAFT_5400 [Neurospora crassa]|eukprot:XP_001728270.2 hypothetical protein NCU11043 [Neurospora crassa OR74A]